MPANSTNPDGTPSVAYLQWAGRQLGRQGGGAPAPPGAAPPPPGAGALPFFPGGGGGGGGIGSVGGAPAGTTDNAWGPQSTGSGEFQSLSAGPSASGYDAAKITPPGLPVDAYRQALQRAYAPQFEESQAQLGEHLAGMGILTSGAGNKAFQDLTARNNATISQGLLPLIQEGYTENAQAGTANAGATNRASEFGAGARNTAAGQGYTGALNSLMSSRAGAQGAGLSTGLANLGEMGATGRSNAGIARDIALANLGAGEKFQLAQMDYTNRDYMQRMQQLYGLNQTGMQGSNTLLNTGLGAGADAYTGTNRAGMPYAAKVGAGSVPTPPGTPPNPNAQYGLDANGNPLPQYPGTGDTTSPGDMGFGATPPPPPPEPPFTGVGGQPY